MKHTLLSFSLLSKLLNVSRAELPRVSVCWVMNFFLRVGFVIGWTLLTAMFVTRFGIAKLPYLFITNAVFVILGTVLYSEIIHRFRKDVLIILSALFGSFTLLGSLFFPENFVFFALLIVVQSVFLSQLHILIWLFAEKLFSPLESQRAFPLIESAETLGMLAGGALIAALASSIPGYKFIYIWILTLVLIIPALFLFRSYVRKIPFLNIKRKRPLTLQSVSQLQRMTSGARELKKNSLVKTLFVIVLCQWIFVSLLEFQYTKAVNQSVTHAGESTIVLDERQFTVSLLLASHAMKRETPEPRRGKELFSSEQELTQNLGALHILFAVSALLIQLLFASRLIGNLGIAGSLLLHPVVLILGLFGMTFRFNFFSAVIARNNFEISNTVFKNAYHSSFYVLSRSLRQMTKEFLDGLVRPIGTILGMGFLLGFGLLYAEAKFTLSINEFMLFILLIMIWAIVRFRRAYTQLSKRHLLGKGETSEKLQAIEILSQPGHHDPTSSLVKTLADSHESVRVKTAVLEALERLSDPVSISAIVHAFSDKSHEVRRAAVAALRPFAEYLDDHVMLQHTVIDALRKLFRREPHHEVQAEIIEILSMFNHAGVVDFLLDILKHSAPSLQALCLKFFRRVEDQHLNEYILPYLDSRNPEVRAGAIIALWDFPLHHAVVRDLLDSMLADRRTTFQMSAFAVVSEVGYEKKLFFVRNTLKNARGPLRLRAALTLAQLGESDGLPVLLDFYLARNSSVIRMIREELLRAPDNIQRHFEKMLYQEVSCRVTQRFSEENVSTLQECTDRFLRELKGYYNLVGQFAEAASVQRLISERRLA